MPFAGISAFMMFLTDQHGLKRSLTAMLGLQKMFPVPEVTRDRDFSIDSIRSGNVDPTCATLGFHLSLQRMDEAQLAQELINSASA